MKTLALAAHTFLLFFALSVSAAFALDVPERLEYELNWSGLTAGKAVQQVSAEGSDLKIVNTIHSSGLASVVMSIDDETESLIPRKSQAMLPRFYKERINEGKTHNLKEGRFDHERLKVDCKDLLKKTEKSDPISAKTYDSLSSVYFIRSSKLEPGETIHFDMYDFKHLWNTEVKVVKREEVTTPLGKFKTVVVTSRLTSNGVAAKAGSSTVWLTDDARRIPVKITTELKVGEITMTLVGGSYWH